MAVLFLLPLNLRMASVCTIFLFILTLLEGGFVDRFKQLFSEQKEKGWLFVMSLLMYALVVFSFPMIDSSQDAFFELERNLSFFVFPIIVLSSQRFVFQKRDQRKLLISGILGLLAASIYDLVLALIRFSDSGLYTEFYYAVFSVLMHPSYFALLLVLGISVLTYILLTSWYRLYPKERFASIALILFFLVIVVLSNSRAGMIAAGLTFVFYAIYWVVKSRRFLFGGILFALMFAGLIGIKVMMPHVFDRFATMTEVFQVKNISEIKHWNGTTLRLQVYYSNIDLIKKNPIFGVGPGNTHKALLENYREHGFRHAEEREYNSHNQYLQVLVGLGLIGFIPFMAMHIYTLIVAIRRKDLMLFSFIIIIMFMYLFESVLQRQAGLMIILFVWMLLFARPYIFKVSKRELTIE
jgi:O-antigen ligase